MNYKVGVIDSCRGNIEYLLHSSRTVISVKYAANNEYRILTTSGHCRRKPKTTVQCTTILAHTYTKAQEPIGQI